MTQASEKQMYWIVKLVDEKVISDELREEIKLGIKRANITKEDAKKYLDVLFDKKTPNIPVDGAVTEPGFYQDNSGNVFKVQASKTGNLYAKFVTVKGFVYAPGKVKNLKTSQKMTVEQIIAYGLQSKVCCNCSTPFSDPISKFIGLGPKCGPDLMGKEAYSAAKKAAKADPNVVSALAYKEALKKEVA